MSSGQCMVAFAAAAGPRSSSNGRRRRAAATACLAPPAAGKGGYRRLPPLAAAAADPLRVQHRGGERLYPHAMHHRPSPQLEGLGAGVALAAASVCIPSCHDAACDAGHRGAASRRRARDVPWGGGAGPGSASASGGPRLRATGGASEKIARRKPVPSACRALVRPPPAARPAAHGTSARRCPREHCTTNARRQRASPSRTRRRPAAAAPLAARQGRRQQNLHAAIMMCPLPVRCGARWPPLRACRH